MSFWDTIRPGSTATLGSHRFTGEEIVRFARRYDPQVFHLNEEAAKDTLFGGLCASGWHTSAVMMRLIVDDQQRRVADWMAAGHARPRLGPSPGVRNLRWIRPVYAGDTTTYRQTITAKRPSASRPGWGLVETSVEAGNQNGEPVFAVEASVFIGID
jgi:acyl dehydratase